MRCARPSYGLGATRLETAVRIVLPAALSGVAAAFIVAISRAIGETMIVAIAAGAGPNFTFSPFRAAETMTGHIVRISGGDLSYELNRLTNSIFAIGLLLLPPDAKPQCPGASGLFAASVRSTNSGNPPTANCAPGC